MKPIVGWGGFRQDRSFALGVLVLAGTAVVADYTTRTGSTSSACRCRPACSPPPKRVRMAYSRNWTIQADVDATVDAGTQTLRKDPYSIASSTDTTTSNIVIAAFGTSAQDPMSSSHGSSTARMRSRKQTAARALGRRDALALSHRSDRVPSNNGTAATLSLKRSDDTVPSTLAPLFVGMRADASSGALFEGRQIVAPLSLTISSGSTFGIASGAPFRIWDLLIDDAGTFRIGSIVCTTATSFFPLDETKLISSTAEGGIGAADSAGVIYTDVAVTNKPFRILGSRTYESGLATAGTWNVDPTVQMFGPGVKKPGEQIQTTTKSNSTVTTGSTNFTSATATPPNTEGDEFFSTPITPLSAANWIEHDILLYCDTVPGRFVIGALFQDSTVNAIAAAGHRSSDFDATAVVPKALPIRHRHLARTSSQTTFKVRAGVQNLSSLMLNGLQGTTQLLGGLITSSHRITEYAA
jgi:hypothetical protein